jgi:hypothetical protein
MKELRMRAFFGLLGIAGAGFLLSSLTTSVGCSDGGTGTAGTGGSSAGTAGSTGTAGTTGSGGNSSGGSGGGGGATGTLGCQVSDPPMGAPTIADFAALDGGAPVLPIGGTFVYPTTGGPVATVTNGAWHITDTTTAMATSQYRGVGIYFNGNAAGTNCVDGTAYTGVQFDISGTVGGTGCSMQYSTNDSAHSDNASDVKGSGGAGVYAPQAQLTVTSTVQTVMMPFSGAGAPKGGNPALAVDKAKLTGVQWQFTTLAPTGVCMVDITIDNVKFY